MKLSKYIVALISGIVFAVGLGVAGMTQPSKVLGFLDIFGKWDPTLMFVMMGAISTYVVFYAFTKKRTASLLGEELCLPKRRDIDKNLVVGAMIFGAGWGIAGFCPGPALTSLVSGSGSILVFVAAMASGMVLYKAYSGIREQYRQFVPRKVSRAVD